MSQNEAEITRLAHKLKWPGLANYKKHEKTESGFEENLLTLLRLEDEQRDKALTRRRIKQAGFPITKTLDTFESLRVHSPRLAALPYRKKEKLIPRGLPRGASFQPEYAASSQTGAGAGIGAVRVHP